MDSLEIRFKREVTSFEIRFMRLKEDIGPSASKMEGGGGARFGEFVTKLFWRVVLGTTGKILRQLDLITLHRSADGSHPL